MARKPPAIPPPPAPSAPPPRPLRPRLWQAAGLGLFLFIPAVLYLFVAHPTPVGWSLAAGLVLMLGHRTVARPYMATVAASKCLWCNRMPARPGGTSDLVLETGDSLLRPVCCPEHGPPLGRFFAFVEAWRWPLRLGIFLPLAALLASLAATAAGYHPPLEAVTAAFQLIVGATVSGASLGYRAMAPTTRARVPFPVHNFYLLGTRSLLWIFRLVGLWWVVRGAGRLLGA